MRILVSGSTGLVGTSLIEKLGKEGHRIARLLRPESEKKGVTSPWEEPVRWDPVTGEFDAAAAEGSDALVHLAGASIADGRWSASRKNLIRSSRINATRVLMRALAKLKRPPRVVVAASAIGYYGNRGDETLTEASPPGSGFLADTCREWEAETARAAEFGARIVNLRFGIVLAAHEGALPKMALPFKFGAGGRIAAGRQWMSWVALTDVIAIIQFAIANSQLSGPANTVAPNPVRNSEFTRILAKTLHRPALFPAPAFALRLALGEMADALLLSSQKVVPSKLEQNGYKFSYPDLGTALHEIFQL